MADINGSLLVQGDISAVGEYKNLHVEQLAADPVAGDLTKPRIWFNTTTDTLRFYNGVATVNLGAAGAAGVTPEELQTALEDYTTTTALTTLLGDFTTSTELTTALNGYVLATALTTALGDYVKSADLATEIELIVEGSFHAIDSPSAITHTITHNLGYRWPNVQVADAVTNKQIIPDSVEFTTANELVITLGVAAALKGGVVWVKTA